MRTKTILLFMVAMALLLGLCPMLHATNIAGTCGMTVGTPGYYMLQNSITGCNPSFAAITISADNVVLDLNGKTVGGAGSYHGIYINGASNVTIRNGVVEKFSHGILLLGQTDASSNVVKNSESITIENMTIRKNPLRGIYGARTGTVRNLIVRNSNISENTNGGIVIFNVTGGQIYDNKLCKNGKFAISLTSTQCITIRHNSITNNITGIVLSPANDNEITENSLCYNYGGIYIYGGNGNRISYNNIIDSTNIQADDGGSNSWSHNYWSKPPLASVVDSAPLDQRWPYAPECDCGTGGSVCGYKFSDLNGDGKWTASNNTLFNYDFGDGEDLSAWKVKRGTWVKDGGFLKQTDSAAGFPEDPLIFYEQQKYAAFSFSSEVTPVGGQLNFGLVFFAQDEKHYDLFWIYSYTGQMGIIRRAGDTWEQVTPGRMLPYPIQAGRTYKVKVISSPSDNKAQFYFDDVLYFSLDLKEVFGCRAGYLGMTTIWSAANFDKVNNSAEPGIAGWQITLTGAKGSVSTTTASDGSYCFYNVAAGAYTVSETPKQDWQQTAPPTGTYPITVADGQSYCFLNFGNRAICNNPGISVEKSGPLFAKDGDALTFTYKVRNTGNVSLSNATVTDDRCGQATYLSGDTSNPGKLDTTEEWTFSCTYTPSFSFPNCMTNIATAAGYFGSQRVEAKDDYMLCPFVLRKMIYLYWDHTGTIPLDQPDNTQFTVEMRKDDTAVGTVSISQAGQTNLWLSEGSWKFCEVNVPANYLPGYDCISYTTGQGYPDWTYPNVLTYDLAIVKSGPQTAKAGQTITYTYTVTNAGPAAVTPQVTDDKCSPLVYQGSDANADGKIQSTETWTYTCQYTIPAGISGCITNTAVVKDPNQPTGWALGGDRNPANNTSSWQVCISEQPPPPYQKGEFCTYTQGGWGAAPNGNNVGQLLWSNFDSVYPSQKLEVGIQGSGPNECSMLFRDLGNLQSYAAITAYLPSSGTPGRLYNDYVDPASNNESGVFGGQTLALQLNVDFSAAGVMPQTGGVVGSLKVCNTGTSMDGKTVADVLAAANTALGGGSLPAGLDYSGLSGLADNLNQAFDNCNPSTWAQDHLCRPSP